jgi:hypothetical protein
MSLLNRRIQILFLAAAYALYKVREVIASALSVTSRLSVVAEQNLIARRIFVACSQVSAVGPDYFRALRIPLEGGRGITALDGPDAAPVAVISQALARRYFPNENPLGQRIKLKIGTESLTVMGLAADFHQHIYDREPQRNSTPGYADWE